MPHDKCFHFNGIMNDRCEAGVAYEGLPGCKGLDLVCLGKDPEASRLACPKFRPWTDEEKAERKASLRRAMDLLGRGLSACCEEPLDEGRVIRSGRHKGHGPRFCSKCGTLAFVV